MVAFPHEATRWGEVIVAQHRVARRLTPARAIGLNGYGTFVESSDGDARPAGEWVPSNGQAKRLDQPLMTQESSRPGGRLREASRHEGIVVSGNESCGRYRRGDRSALQPPLRHRAHVQRSKGLELRPRARPHDPRNSRSAGSHAARARTGHHVQRHCRSCRRANRTRPHVARKHRDPNTLSRCCFKATSTWLAWLAQSSSMSAERSMCCGVSYAQLIGSMRFFEGMPEPLHRRSPG
jgi:hypothetical protein